jgi:hypothetical protein
MRKWNKALLEEVAKVIFKGMNQRVTNERYR